MTSSADWTGVRPVTEKMPAAVLAYGEQIEINSVSVQSPPFGADGCLGHCGGALNAVPVRRVGLFKQEIYATR